MARQWKAYNQWRYSRDGYKYLESALAGIQVSVYKDDDPVFDAESFSGYSFSIEDKTRMGYSDYLAAMSKQAVGMTLRDSSGQLNAVLGEDIAFPEFYHDMANYMGMQFTQGQFFVDNAHYERADQFLCVVDGSAMIRLVPHINRQEMYVGEKYSYFHPNRQEVKEMSLRPNESPVNLFKPDFDTYPNVKFVNKVYKEFLSPGDCIYVPAFYFFQVAGEAEA
jgi:hypothetical protein